MTYEVEQKFPVAEREVLERRLCELGIRLGDPVVQEDQYVNHPARDFGETDEAFRIRSVGEQNFLTYKGPKLDQTTKTRSEIEVGVAHGPEAAARLGEMFKQLGFRPVLAVRKERRKAQVAWRGRTIELVLDEVSDLGTFVELEVMAEKDDMQAAKEAIASLAKELGLTANERRSYLELLLEAKR